MKTHPTIIMAACQEQGLVCIPDIGIYDSDGTLLLQADEGNAHPTEDWWRFGVPGWKEGDIPMQTNQPNNVLAEHWQQPVCDLHPTYICAEYLEHEPEFKEALADLRAYARRCREALEEK
jgi:hypothetical protein